MADINATGGETVASHDPANLVFQQMDVTRAADWKATIDLAFERFGRLDVLVNNAGTTYRNKVCYVMLYYVMLSYDLDSVYV